jgi:hypothetical protein
MPRKFALRSWKFLEIFFALKKMRMLLEVVSVNFKNLQELEEKNFFFEKQKMLIFKNVESKEENNERRESGESGGAR